MSREVYSFSSGPGMMPLDVLQTAHDELMDWHGVGLGVMEMSHRSAEFTSINEKTHQDIRKLMSVPDNYKIMLMQGGASLQYAAVPMNILSNKTTANYLVTGYASTMAYEEVKKFCNPHLVAPIVEGFRHLPKQFDFVQDAAYVYYTDNETVNGVEFQQPPSFNDQPLVCDMSSSIGTKLVDVSKYGVIFASVSSNMGPEGLTVVIARDDLVGQHHPNTPSMFNWKLTYDCKSIFNTTPCFAVYLTGLYVDYLNKNGGVQVFAQLAEKRAKLIYDVIDSSHNFYKGMAILDRSRTNAVFHLPSNELEEKFLKESEAVGLVELRGHPSVGGIRVSMYNGMPMEGVQKLRDFMVEFEQKNSQTI